MPLVTRVWSCRSCTDGKTSRSILRKGKLIGELNWLAYHPGIFRAAQQNLSKPEIGESRSISIDPLTKIYHTSSLEVTGNLFLTAF